VARALAAPRDTGLRDDDDEDGDDGLDEWAALGGTAAAAVAEIRDRPKLPVADIAVWEENVPVVQWFLGVTTQWRRSAASGLPVGLDYVGAREVARFDGIEVTPAMFKGLQVMELAYMKEAARRAPRPSQPQRQVIVVAPPRRRR
jgi:hypothetical protein